MKEWYVTNYFLLHYNFSVFSKLVCQLLCLRFVLQFCFCLNPALPLLYFYYLKNLAYIIIYKERRLSRVMQHTSRKFLIFWLSIPSEEPSHFNMNVYIAKHIPHLWNICICRNDEIHNKNVLQVYKINFKYSMNQFSILRMVDK